MQYPVRLETVPADRRLAVVRRRASRQDLSRVVPEACGIVWNVLRTNGYKGAGRHVAVYWDDKINLEVGVELDAPFAGSGDVVASALPAGAAATAVHFGAYHRLHETHTAVRDWCALQGQTLAGPNWEIYGHWEDAWNNDASKIRTDVFYLVAPVRKSRGD